MDNRYTCNDACISIENDEFIKLIFSKLLLDINTRTIQNELFSKLTRIESLLKTSKKELKKYEQKIRYEIQNHIQYRDITNINNLKKEIKILISDKEVLENKITSIGEEKYRLNFCINNMEKFKSNLFKIEDEDIKYFDEHFDELNGLFTKFIKKAVLYNKLSNDEFSIKIDYTQQ